MRRPDETPNSIRALHNEIARKVLGRENANAGRAVELHKEKLKDDPQTAEEMAVGLKVFNEHGTLFKAGTGRYFVRVKTEDMGAWGSEPGRSHVGALSAMRNRANQLREARVDRRAYGEKFKVAGRQNKAQHEEFTIILDDFITLCAQYGVAISPDLQPQIDQALRDTATPAPGRG